MLSQLPASLPASAMHQVVSRLSLAGLLESHSRERTRNADAHQQQTPRSGRIDTACTTKRFADLELMETCRPVQPTRQCQFLDQFAHSVKTRGNQARDLSTA